MRAGRYLQIVVLASLVALSVGQPARLRGFRGAVAQLRRHKLLQQVRKSGCRCKISPCALR